jgi:2-methylcitrate dehydratase PrpD
MIAKVNFGVHPEAEAAGFDKMTTIIEIELADGKLIRGQADFGKGSPANPMSDAELAEKFSQCAAWGGLTPAQAKAVLDLVWRIEEVKDVNELTCLLGRV